MTITLTREEAQQVLELITNAYVNSQLAETLRAKLAQPEPKPSAWAVQEGVNLHDVFLFKDEADEMCHLKGDHAKAIPLYTSRLSAPEPEQTRSEKMREAGITRRPKGWSKEDEPKPVAWMLTELDGTPLIDCGDLVVKPRPVLVGDKMDCIPLYTAPPQREWQGLTDEELLACYSNRGNVFYRAIEAKLKEKNT
jgi:hypothetical protein